jgi:coenzyme PQQ precursor peptide PqqA
MDPSSDVNIQQRESAMTWNTPKIVEIAVGLEINSYACATV